MPPADGAYPAGTSEGRAVGTTTCMPAARSSRAPRPFTVSVQASKHFGHWNLTMFPDSGVPPPSSSTNSASPMGVSTVPHRSHVLRRRVLTNPMVPRQGDSAPSSTEISGKRKANSGCQHAGVSRSAQNAALPPIRRHLCPGGMSLSGAHTWPARLISRGRPGSLARNAITRPDRQIRPVTTRAALALP